MNSNGLSCCLGYGQEKGGISCILYNRHPEKDLVVVVMETVPWFLRVYLHTLSIESFLSDDVAENGTVVKPSELIQSTTRLDKPLKGSFTLSETERNSNFFSLIFVAAQCEP